MIQYKVVLNSEEQAALNKITAQGKHSARTIKRANILLMSDTQQYTETEIAESLSVSGSTVYRTKKYFVEYGMEEALYDSPRSGQPRKLDGNQEALLIAITCSEPPEGRCRWTLSMLGEQIISLTELENVSPETIRQRLKENDLKPWQKKMWCIGKLDAAYIARMEHILDLYAEPADIKRPVVNFDEAGKQLVEQVNEPNFMKPGRVTQEDYEYKRAGMANIFMFFDRHRGWRKAKVTEQKTSLDFSECMRELVDQDYPDAEVIQGAALRPPTSAR
jgi:transposase